MLTIILAVASATLGIGADTCGQWKREHAAFSARASQEDQWTLGFATALQERINDDPGVGAHPPVRISVTDGGVLRGVDKTCGENSTYLIRNVTAAEILDARATALMDQLRTEH